MVNFLKAYKGGAIWLAGVIISILIMHVVPELVTAGETIYASTEIQGIIGVLILIITIGLMLIWPNALIIPALQEPNTIDNKLGIYFLSAVLFLLTLLLTIKGWYMLEAIYTIIETAFIRAKLDDKTKEFIQESVVNAYFIKRIIQMLAKRTKPTWNNQTKQWQTTPANKEHIYRQADQAFHSYITKIEITTITNRNTKTNHILNLFAKVRQTEEPPEPEQQPTEKLYDKIINKKQPENN